MSDDPADPFGSKAWANFATKLLDTARDVFHPQIKRRITDGDIDAKRRHADADIEIEQKLLIARRQIAALEAAPVEITIVRALSPASPVPETIDDAELIPIEVEEPVSLESRAQERVSELEQRRQLNVEKVLRGAAFEFDGSAVSEDPVDDDWRSRFFTAAQDVSNEEMQKVWARLLAGEVQRPGTFSLRTLDVVRNVTAAEAKLFAKFATYSCEGRVFRDALEAHGDISFSDILTLQDAQLVLTPSLQSAPQNMATEPGSFTGRFVFKTTALSFKRQGDEPMFPQEVWKLTGPGAELARLVRGPDDLLFIRRVASFYEVRGFEVAANQLLGDLEEGAIGEVIELPNIPER